MNNYSLEIQADGCDEKGNDLWKLVVIDRTDLATNLLPKLLAGDNISLACQPGNSHR